MSRDAIIAIVIIIAILLLMFSCVADAIKQTDKYKKDK